MLFVLYSYTYMTKYWYNYTIEQIIEFICNIINECVPNL